MIKHDEYLYEKRRDTGEDGRVTVEAEIGVMHLASKYRRLDEGKKDSSLQVSEGACIYQHLDFGLLGNKFLLF